MIPSHTEPLGPCFVSRVSGTPSKAIITKKYTKMVFLGLRGKKLLAGITVSSGLGFILFGSSPRLYYLCFLQLQMDASAELEHRC